MPGFMPTRWFVLVTLVWFGCGVLHDGAEDVEHRRWRLELATPLASGPTNGDASCVHSIASAVLSVNGRRYVEEVVGDTVTFDVSGIPQGDVSARAVLLSNTGDTLYVAEDRRTIRVDDFGTIDMRVEKRNPVLVVCPGLVRLTADRQYSAHLLVANKGSQRTGRRADTLFWETDEEFVCSEDASCVRLRPVSGSVTTPDSTEMTIEGEAADPDAELAFYIRSRFGHAQVRIQFEGGP